MTRVLYVTEQ